MPKFELKRKQKMPKRNKKNILLQRRKNKKKIGVLSQSAKAVDGPRAGEMLQCRILMPLQFGRFKTGSRPKKKELELPPKKRPIVYASNLLEDKGSFWLGCEVCENWFHPKRVSLATSFGELLTGTDVGLSRMRRNDG